MSFLKKSTARLVLRALEASDYSAWVEFWNSNTKAKNEWDIANRRRTNLSRKDFSQVLKLQKTRRKNDDYYDFLAFRKSDGKIIGSISIMDVSRGLFQSAYLGYSISNQFWGMGYGKEAVRACIDLAFTALKLHRIEAGISPHNKRSIALAKSLRMRKEGRKARALFLDERWQDMMVYALTCEDWGLKFRGPKLTLSNRR